MDGISSGETPRKISIPPICETRASRAKSRSWGGFLAWRVFSIMDIDSFGFS